MNKNLLVLDNVGVDIIVPEDVEVVCLASKIGVPEMTVAVAGQDKALPVNFPLIQLVNAIKTMPPEEAKPFAAHATSKILQAAGIEYRVETKEKEEATENDGTSGN